MYTIVETAIKAINTISRHAGTRVNDLTAIHSACTTLLNINRFSRNEKLVAAIYNLLGNLVPVSPEDMKPLPLEDENGDVYFGISAVITSRSDEPALAPFEEVVVEACIATIAENRELRGFGCGRTSIINMFDSVESYDDFMMNTPVVDDVTNIGWIAYCAYKLMMREVEAHPSGSNTPTLF